MGADVELVAHEHVVGDAEDGAVQGHGGHRVDAVEDQVDGRVAQRHGVH